MIACQALCNKFYNWMKRSKSKIFNSKDRLTKLSNFNISMHFKMLNLNRKISKLDNFKIKWILSTVIYVAKIKLVIITSGTLVKVQVEDAKIVAEMRTSTTRKKLDGILILIILLNSELIWFDYLYLFLNQIENKKPSINYI